MAEEKYINQTLLEGLQVFEKFMTELSPFTAYTVGELSEIFGHEYNKTLRIVRTLQHIGFVQVDESGKKYSISRRVLELPLRYLRALHAEHLKIKTAVETFEIFPHEPGEKNPKP